MTAQHTKEYGPAHYGCACHIDVSGFIRLCPLHASAPDLLAALERIAEYESRYQDSASYRVARAAILAAKGEK